MDSRLVWKDHIKAKGKQLHIKERKLYCLLGHLLELSLSNKVVLYKVALTPIWTYDIQLWGRASHSNLEIIQRYQSKTVRIIANAPWLGLKTM